MPQSDPFIINFPDEKGQRHLRDRREVNDAMDKKLKIDRIVGKPPPGFRIQSNSNKCHRWMNDEGFVMEVGLPEAEKSVYPITKKQATDAAWRNYDRWYSVPGLEPKTGAWRDIDAD